MTLDQGLVFAILGGALVLFVWNRWRYDIVALTALAVALVVGVVPAADAFDGFGHPAVITVAAVLVLSRALTISGALDALAERLQGGGDRPLLQLGALSSVAAGLSAFMNNVGALALLLPVALRSGPPRARLLMPLSFASILGGMVTLIGTPPNIVVAGVRAEELGAPYRLFDFAPVGGVLAVLGLVYVLTIGRRLIPAERTGGRSPEELFDIAAYVAEFVVAEGSKASGMTLGEVEAATGDEARVIDLVRRGRRRRRPSAHETLREGDVVILRGELAALQPAVDDLGLTLAPHLKSDDDRPAAAKLELSEAVVQPSSRLEGRIVRNLRLRRRFAVNLLALAREGRPARGRLRDVRLRAGDVLLLQGEPEDLAEAVAALGLLPLAGRALRFGARRRAWLPVAVFAAAIVVTAVGLLPVQASFTIAVAVLLLSGALSPRDAYEAVDWPVIVLLGALIPIGHALDAGGGSALVARLIVDAAGALPAVVLVALLMIVTMTLSDVMNNAATAVVMAPIALSIAATLGTSPDPLLMAVAVGASCAFLTPIGHQNNVLVMGPGGYRFSDYWRMGLPLEVLIVVVGTPLIVAVWPL